MNNKTHFRTCFFTVIASKNEKFSKTYLDGIFRTIVMSFGEMEFLDQYYANQTKNDSGFPTGPDGRQIIGLEVEIYLARLIFMVFAFLFPIVVMNLLNAIAIGDIQVKYRSTCMKAINKVKIQIQPLLCNRN